MSEGTLHRMITAYRLFLFLFAAEILVGQPHTYTVCELLASLPKLNGEVITINARLISDSSTWLKEDKCDSPLTVGEYAFDNLIAVDWPDSYLVRRTLPNRELFPLDSHGRNRISSAINSNPPNTEIRVTIKGMIVTRLPLALLVHPRSPTTPIGYGHLGAAPAMIVVKEVVGFKVFRSP